MFGGHPGQPSGESHKILNLPGCIGSHVVLYNASRVVMTRLYPERWIMDVKKKLQEIADRSKADESFNQLMQDDFEEAMKACGISSVDEFARELVADAMSGEGDLSDEDLDRVSGGTRDMNSLAAAVGGSDTFSNSLIDWVARKRAQVGI